MLDHNSIFITYIFDYLDGSVVEKYCGNGIRCCDICAPYNSNSDCLAVLYDDLNTRQEAEELCKLSKDNPKYCQEMKGKLFFSTFSANRNFWF